MNKEEIRGMVKSKISAIEDKAERSRRIRERLLEFPVFQDVFAKREPIMLYVNRADEVETLPLLDLLEDTAVVPYCENGDIRLFRLKSRDELEIVYYGIPEPRISLRRDPDRDLDPKELKLILLPGLAFDLHGNRLGRGAGYYDRFLQQIPHETPKIALSFDCQIFDSIPTDPHDQPVDCIITESRIVQQRKWKTAR